MFWICPSAPASYSVPTSKLVASAPLGFVLFPETACYGDKVMGTVESYSQVPWRPPSQRLSLPWSGLQGVLKLWLILSPVSAVGYGSWFEHVQEFWEHRMDSNVLFLKYEDMHRVSAAALALAGPELLMREPFPVGMREEEEEPEEGQKRGWDSPWAGVGLEMWGAASQSMRWTGAAMLCKAEGPRKVGVGRGLGLGLLGGLWSAVQWRLIGH
ncbi:hypothetical protein P7K49_002356 [Saguinus oedipus]|uniref:Sulfotransferase n=1 Tax=Saguinus oedipus TaxID=9490 RepID=A0ABQ9WHN8_SAGOE|nr:hypothetical protein P7K49_002356 [Saguinus oedipus]